MIGLDQFGVKGYRPSFSPVRYGKDPGMTQDERLALLARQFADPPEFDTSPLYTALSATVAQTPALLRLAARGQPGQYPTFLFFAAVQALLRGGADHELALFYPPHYPRLDGNGSLHATEIDPRAGAALIDFVAQYEAELTRLIETRLVQTNIVKRSLALRVGLAAIGSELGISGPGGPEPGAPLHLIEVGASAGIHLRFDKFGYRLGDQRFGPADSPVQISSVWHGRGPVPDLDAIPAVSTTTGIDLNPLDATDPADRGWLESLVFPENGHQAALLSNALDIVAADPPVIHRGDAIDLCPELARRLPPGEPRVVFHAATRLHVPADRRDAFDAAIDSLGQDAPLYLVCVERPPDPDPRPQPARPGVAVTLRTPDGRSTDLAVAEGRLEWIEPLGDWAR